MLSPIYCESPLENNKNHKMTGFGEFLHVLQRQQVSCNDQQFCQHIVHPA